MRAHAVDRDPLEAHGLARAAAISRGTQGRGLAPQGGGALGQEVGGELGGDGVLGIAFRIDPQRAQEGREGRHGLGPGTGRGLGVGRDLAVSADLVLDELVFVLDRPRLALGQRLLLVMRHLGHGPRPALALRRNPARAAPSPRPTPTAPSPWAHRPSAPASARNASSTNATCSSSGRPRSRAPCSISSRFTDLAKLLLFILRITESGVASARVLPGCTRAVAVIMPQSSSEAKSALASGVTRGVPV